MANWSDPSGPTTSGFPGVGTVDAALNAGLRSYMLSVYNYMASGVLLSGIVAMLFSRWLATSPAAFQMVYGSPLRWVIALAPLAFVMVMSFGINRLSITTTRALYWAFAVLMGISLSSIFFVYDGTSIATAFFATAASFAGLSLFGYTTKKDLSGFGTFLIMGLVGIIVASIINIFVGSGTMALVISILGVLIFAGLTAYDTQKIKTTYFQVAGSEFAAKAVVMGSLNLYLDFINMFLFILRLFGNRN